MLPLSQPADRQTDRQTDRQAAGQPASPRPPAAQADFFGERALLYDEPRIATVEALMPLTCLVLDRATFSEVLGPWEQVLAREKSPQVGRPGGEGGGGEGGRARCAAGAGWEGGRRGGCWADEQMWPPAHTHVRMRA
jgi:hypothetical protein